MTVFLTYKSALQFWRLNGIALEENKLQQSWKMPTPEPPNTSVLLRAAARGLSLPLDIAVMGSETRRPSQITRPHVIGSHLPDGCFVDAGEGLFVSSPELCFIQMARELSLIELIELGFELCGSYSLPALEMRTTSAEASGTDYRKHPPFTNVKKLSSLAARISKERGTVRATRALRYLIDNSASPRETILAMLLTLPYLLGGYSLPFPELNAKIQPTKTMLSTTNKSHYYCDLYWPIFRLAAEYDSNLHHTGAERIANDSKRRNTLTALGITVITVTNQQLTSPLETERVAKLLASNMGKRLRFNENEKFLKARRELREQLFASR